MIPKYGIQITIQCNDEGTWYWRVLTAQEDWSATGYASMELAWRAAREKAKKIIG